MKPCSLITYLRFRVLPEYQFFPVSSFVVADGGDAVSGEREGGVYVCT